MKIPFLCCMKLLLDSGGSKLGQFLSGLTRLVHEVRKRFMNENGRIQRPRLRSLLGACVDLRLITIPFGFQKLAIKKGFVLFELKKLPPPSLEFPFYVSPKRVSRHSELIFRGKCQQCGNELGPTFVAVDERVQSKIDQILLWMYGKSQIVGLLIAAGVTDISLDATNIDKKSPSFWTLWL